MKDVQKERAAVNNSAGQLSFRYLPECVHAPTGGDTRPPTSIDITSVGIVSIASLRFPDFNE